MDYPAISLEALSSLLRSGELPLTHYLKNLLKRLSDEDRAIHAFLPEPEREKRVLEDARFLLDKYPAPEQRPALFGIPVGVKDLFNVDGLPTQAGSKMPSDAFEGPQATVVDRLQRAGAIVLGKTVSTEFAYFSPGPTRNPVNPEHSPGGSSSGSAAAVAQGLCPLALGTQTIASVIRPAAYCGIWGFKPSYGRIPLEGVFPFAQSVDHVGYFAARHEDISFVAPFMVDSWHQETDHPTLSLLIPNDAYLHQADADSQQHFREVVQTLADSGLEIKEIELFPDIEDLNIRHKSLIAAEFALNHHDLYAKYGSLYSPHSRELYLQGRDISSEELFSLRMLPEALRNEIQKIMWQHNANLLLTPGATSTAPQGLSSTGSPLMSLPFTNAGLPSISIPFGADRQGLPFALQVIAASGQDEFLVFAAREIHRALSTSQS
jgi:Asp-tRNA(Asn)/Glu-tRNA(Gln) amidotransferase A subunit family amidase